MRTYLGGLCDELAVQWPANRTVNLVCHGHSVPAGYARTPVVDTFSAYPHLVHRALKERFPYAVINVIVTAVGGENSPQGAARFRRDVLRHAPRLIILDYALNDRSVGLKEAEKAWRSMIEDSLADGVRVMLMTPSWDDSWFGRGPQWKALERHACQIRRLAEEYSAALADSFGAFERSIRQGADLNALLSQSNHPSPAGHLLIAEEIMRWFSACGTPDPKNP